MRKFPTLSGRRPSRTQKLTTAGIAVSAAAIALTAIPGPGDSDANASDTPKNSAASAGFVVKSANVEGQRASLSSKSSTSAAENATTSEAPAQPVAQKSITEKQETAAADMAKKKKAYSQKLADQRLKDKAQERADRTEVRESTYADNLDGWIRESLAIMAEKGIPGSYEGIHRNIIRESGGNPNAINNWDINAINGVPSKGLLQVIKPTFDTYHVDGTAWDQYDPVANITAACNYAADRYGSIDNVNGPY